MALAAGLALGAAMRPDLASDDRPAGPQIFEGWAGTRSTGPFDDGAVAYASYAGKVPDYVVGTDAKRLQAQGWPVAAPAPPAPTARGLAAEDAPPLGPEDLTPAAFDAGSAADPADEAGGAPPASAAWAVAADDEAPPQATGDTRPPN